MTKKSILEAELLEKSPTELKEHALRLFERQRQLREERKNDPRIAEIAEYQRTMYGEPNTDLEKQIKVVRRIFKLRNIIFNFQEAE